MANTTIVTASETMFEWSEYFDKSPDLICIANIPGYFEKVNAAVLNTLGYTMEELLSTPIGHFVHPDDKERTVESRKNVLGGNVLTNFQNRYVAKNGSIVWLEWTSIYFPDKKIVFAIAKDVTQRKEMENEVLEKYNKFKSLATHFKNSIEKDRKFLAYELHEELAQLSAAVKMEVDMISMSERELNESAKNKLAHVSGIAGLLMKTIQRISFSISPSMLEEFGLHETMEWLCKEFSILNGIPCHYSGQFDEDSMSFEIKTDFFRICQESLSNVMYHAQASNIYINIAETENNITLSISDDGKGFDVNKHSTSSGISSMKKRAASINGTIEIESVIGKGTSLVVYVNK
jgi:PAS domain S-box-containing protein